MLLILLLFLNSLTSFSSSSSSSRFSRSSSSSRFSRPSSASIPSPSSLRVLSWNLENLFDTRDDADTNDEEYLPEGERHWTPYRYWQKLTEVARVVVALEDEGGIPDIIGLCEVENDTVLTALTRRSPLRQLDYSYVMTNSEDARGIDVALLYQPARFRLLTSRSIRVPSREQGLRPTRDILYAKGLVLTSTGIDTLHVFVVHLPSRAGGRAGDKNRRLAAQTLWAAVDSVGGWGSVVGHGAYGAALPLILVMGDFNAGPRDKIFKGAPLRLTDDPHAPGTYCYRGYWQWLDHILISPSLLTAGPAMPVMLPWLLEENRTYGGDMPRRTYRGPTYHGGISDHLPILITLLP